MATREVFSDEEINRAELIRHFTLTGADEAFVRRFRGQGNTLGAAVQLCVLPWLGFVPDEVRSAPAAAVVRLSERLGIPVGALREYGVREQTRTDHLREVTRYLGWRTMDELAWKQLQEFLFARAMEHDAPRLLFRLACESRRAEAAVSAGVRVPGLGAADPAGAGEPAGAHRHRPRAGPGGDVGAGRPHRPWPPRSTSSSKGAAMSSAVDPRVVVGSRAVRRPVVWQQMRVGRRTYATR